MFQNIMSVVLKSEQLKELKMSETNQVYYKIKVGKQRGNDDSSHMRIH